MCVVRVYNVRCVINVHTYVWCVCVVSVYVSMCAEVMSGIAVLRTCACLHCVLCVCIMCVLCVCYVCALCVCVCVMCVCVRMTHNLGMWAQLINHLHTP